MINEYDKYIGERIKERRKELKMTLKKLGEHLNITHQQITKYEKGINKIRASRLPDIAKILGVGILYFYKGADEGRVCVDIKTGTIKVKLPEYFETTTKESDEK